MGEAGYAQTQPAQFRAEGQARDLSVHGGRAEPPGAVRLQAATGEVRRHAAARGAATRAIARRSSIRIRSCSGPEVQVQAVRRERRGIGRTAALHRRDRRRDRDREIDGHGRVQSCARAVADEHGHDAVRTARAWARGCCTGSGSETKDLPGFVVFSSGSKGPSGGDSCWGSGFLPTVYQGVQFRSGGDPVLYLSNPPGVDRELQRDSLDALKQLNQMRAGVTGDPEIATRINSFEMAFRMQAVAPELMDISKEPQGDAGDVRGGAGQSVVRQQLSVGAAAGGEGRAVRAVVSRSLGPAFQPGEGSAKELPGHRPGIGGAGKRPEAARSAGGHAGGVGRGVRAHPDGAGRLRRSRPPSECVHACGWQAAASSAGARIGETDELGFNVAKDKVHVHDLHATMLQLLGSITRG